MMSLMIWRTDGVSGSLYSVNLCFLAVYLRATMTLGRPLLIGYVVPLRLYYLISRDALQRPGAVGP
jgi:hypothetical protein